MHFFNYSLSDIESMYPFEREIFIEMINNHIKEEENKKKKR